MVVTFVVRISKNSDFVFRSRKYLFFILFVWVHPHMGAGN